MFTKSNKDRLGYGFLSVLLLLAFLARVLWLGNIPGINGDEAWYGLQVIGNKPAALQTPSGLPLNPFYIIPLWIFQRIFPPAFWVLRLPSVLAGLLLIILGFLLLKKPIGVIPAAIFAVLCAGLPDLIVYSRFGWDASETGLALLIVFYFALSKKWWACLVAEIAAIIVHPSNIYASVILIVLFGAEHFRYWLGSKLGKKIFGGIGIIIEVSVIFLLFDAKHAIPVELINQVLSLPSWLGMISAYGDIISGVMVYRYISTPELGLSLALHNIIVWTILLSTILLGCWYSIKRHHYYIVVFLAGFLASLVILHFSFLNEEFLAYNRYLQFLIVPTLLLVALCINEIVILSKSPWRPVGLAILLSSLGLFSLATNYFIPLMTTGGLSDPMFYTGPVEPKAAAVGIILGEKPIRSQTIVLAENWWIAEPMQYLLSTHPEYDVIEYDKSGLILIAIENILKQGGYIVGFSQGPINMTLIREIKGLNLSRIELFGYSKKPVIVIWHNLSFPN